MRSKGCTPLSKKLPASKEGLAAGARVAVVLVMIASGVLIFIRGPISGASAASGELTAVYRDGSLEVNVPYDEKIGQAASLGVEVLDPQDRSVGAVHRTVSPIRTSGSWRVSIPIAGNVATEDLAWDRLKISAGGVTKIVSISQALLLPTVRVFAQHSYAAGSTAALRVITADSKDGNPLRDSRVKLELMEGDSAATLFTGRTNALGTAQISFHLPDDTYGARQFRVTAETSLGRVVAIQSVQLERRARILLTTDKPIYQPGQTIHLRALALDGPTRAASAEQPLTLEIEDGKGNKVFKKRGTTDRFGITSADFELADEVNFGPYHVRAILGDDKAQVVQEKTVTVDRYVLPKFKLQIELAGDSEKKSTGGYYKPGDTVAGKITAAYIFGKPIAGAEVTVSLTTFDVQSVELGRLTGKTDAEGHFAFSSKLPDFLAGRSTDQGSASVSIAAEVKDTADHTESKTRNVLVSNTPILIMAVPESGRLLTGLDNRVYLLTSYPDGSPAETEINGNITPATLKTDSAGLATVTIHGDGGPATLDLTATDNAGRSAHASVKVESQSGNQSLMLRANKSVFRVGEMLKLDTMSTRQRGAVYIDLIKDGQTLVTRAIDTSAGHGELALDLTPAMFGAIEVRAYQITTDAEPIVDRRLIYVDPADDLKVEISADRQSYKPGEDATINFRTVDRNGRPVSAALGVEIVDEAVFALSDRQPGFEKVFMYLEKELLTPRYEVHQFTFDRVVRPEPDDDSPLAVGRERAAQVLFAAAGTTADRDTHSEFGLESIEAKRAQYAAIYVQRTVQAAQLLTEKLNQYYAGHPASPQGFDADLKAFAAASPDQAKLLQDPWGNSLIGEGKIDRDWSYISLKSPGPDGHANTPDDITLGLAARHNGSSTRASSAVFRGKIGIENGVIAGGRAALEGEVRDKSGSAISGVQVTIRRESNGRTRSVYTASDGRFVIPDLDPDRYEVRFEIFGYQSSITRAFRLSAGDRGKVETSLATAAFAPVTLYFNGWSTDGPLRDEMRRFEPMGVAGAVRGRMAAEDKAASAPLQAGIDTLALLQPGVTQKKETKDEKQSEAGGGLRVRSFFPETLYTNPALITDGQGRASVRVPMADSITTWRITSLASTQRGMLGSSTFPIKVFQDFFVDLDLPVALTQGDEISIPAAVYNYLPTAQQVSLDLRQDPWFDLDGDSATKQVQVGAGEVGVAYFRIKASKIGEQQLQLTARLIDAEGGHGGDAVARQVNVVPNGEQKAVVFNERLEQTASKEIVIPAGAIADASSIMVKLYPGALSQVVDGLDSILQMPGGCFEQTSSSTYPDVLAMDYMKTAKKITPEIQAKAEGYISLGYQRLVTFEVPGGGFSWFGQAPANKILTSYGLMEFSDMSRVHEVDPRLIERTQNWLAAQQQPDGSFKPDTQFINEGATTHYNTDVLRITAYIGWALSTTGYKGDAVRKAALYCRAHVSGKEDAYTLAVLANFAVDSGDRDWANSAIEALVRQVTEDQKVAYWKQQNETPTSARQESADLETTALAVQALLKSGQRSGLAKKALDYLTSKKDQMGNWQTTQATILSLKAFLLSFTKGADADTAGSVEVSIDGKVAGHVQITKDNNDLLQAVDLKPYTHPGAQQVSLKFDGKGSLEYQIVGRYYMPWNARPQLGEPLSINVTYNRTSLAQNDLATARATVTNNTRAAAKMIMVDLGIPPGFEPVREDFENLLESSRGLTGGKLEKYTITARQVILYFDGLNPNQKIEFGYKLRAKFPVRAKTFSSRVYEYYNPDVQTKTPPIEMTVQAR